MKFRVELNVSMRKLHYSKAFENDPGKVKYSYAKSI